VRSLGRGEAASAPTAASAAAGDRAGPSDEGEAGTCADRIGAPAARGLSGPNADGGRGNLEATGRGDAGAPRASRMSRGAALTPPREAWEMASAKCSNADVSTPADVERLLPMGPPTPAALGRLSRLPATGVPLAPGCSCASLDPTLEAEDDAAEGGRPPLLLSACQLCRLPADRRPDPVTGAPGAARAPSASERAADRPVLLLRCVRDLSLSTSWWTATTAATASA